MIFFIKYELSDIIAVGNQNKYTGNVVEKNNDEFDGNLLCFANVYVHYLCLSSSAVIVPVESNKVWSLFRKTKAEAVSRRYLCYILWYNVLVINVTLINHVFTMVASKNG